VETSRGADGCAVIRVLDGTGLLDVRSSGSRGAAGESTKSAGLMATIDAGVRCAPTSRASAPPIERPATTTEGWRDARRSNSSTAAALHLAQLVRARSRQVPPCPGSRGTLSVESVSSSDSATGRTDDGFPVKPWRRSSAGRCGSPARVHASGRAEGLWATDDDMVPASHTEPDGALGANA
jgi:hypothetical protein